MTSLPSRRSREGSPAEPFLDHRRDHDDERSLVSDRDTAYVHGETAPLPLDVGTGEGGGHPLESVGELGEDFRQARIARETALRRRIAPNARDPHRRAVLGDETDLERVTEVPLELGARPSARDEDHRPLEAREVTQEPDRLGAGDRSLGVLVEGDERPVEIGDHGQARCPRKLDPLAVVAARHAIRA